MIDVVTIYLYHTYDINVGELFVDSVDSKYMSSGIYNFKTIFQNKQQHNK